MELREVMELRRSYTLLEKSEVTEELIRDLARAASLAPSCFNKQPWRFVFVFQPDDLERIFSALSSGNEWAKRASMVIAVVGRREDDCISKGREYFMFDIGMATAFLILRATDLGLVAHPIAGFDLDLVKEALSVPEGFTVITLLIVGKHSEAMKESMTDSEKALEEKRPKRKPFEEFAFIGRFGIDGKRD